MTLLLCIVAALPLRAQTLPTLPSSPASEQSVDRTQAASEAESKSSTRLPAIVPANRKSIGLVLEGGGALGLAHIGVLLWFEQNHIPVDRLTGTSMGALLGGLYASGQTAQDLQKLATDNLFGDIFTLQTPYDQIGYRRRQDRRDLPQALTLGLRHGVSVRNAVLSDSPLNDFLRSRFASNNSLENDFDHLPIPFRCVATDLNTLEPLVFRGGPMPEAIRASISIPGIFSPVSYRGHYLVDGAVTDNLPTSVARDVLNADVVIAVHLKSAGLAESDVGSILGVFARAFEAGTAKTERAGISRADLLITAATETFSTTDYGKAKELIAVGYAAAESQGDRLLVYRLSEEDWTSHLQDRRSRIAPPPGKLLQVSVQGGSDAAQKGIARSLEPLKEKPIDAAAITKSLRQVEGAGNREASFETFQTTPIPPLSGTQAQAPDTGVIVHLGDVRNGPPFLLVGADLTAVTSNVTRNNIDLRLVDQDFGGYGSELRADARFGFLTQGALEYYKPIWSTGFFVQPHLGIIRQPVYLWQNQQRVSERFEQNAGGGLDLGKNFSRQMQITAQWKIEATRWRLVTGEDDTQNLSGAAQTGMLHFSYDTAVTGAVSPHGLRLDVSAGALFHTAMSENAPLAQASVSRTFLFQQKNIFGFRAQGDTYFRRNVAAPFRFTLGGPLRLSASSVDEYRGTDDFFVRGGYLRKIASLPSGLGQGVYLAGAYEAGEMWSPEHRAFLRQDVLGAVVASTPFGVITVAGSAGDAGRRKIFFTLGRLF
ncbi:patatin-like phospholipase family protein [Terriglobus saanensis]|uniref:Patatin n=1 Tax=Terriglobus saanensis (strain ATCC BAA-1853 / DSM 23119 / SP1PR4) TaxID=401053 RepID=E8V463_TERSS|nr:patatin-like phospholipase family protein [Terriglobus saanensis]ADV82554.1 Patatin [Terriglobus saanensis SP1PR4]